jgi:hypothetical protein
MDIEKIEREINVFDRPSAKNTKDMLKYIKSNKIFLTEIVDKLANTSFLLNGGIVTDNIEDIKNAEKCFKEIENEIFNYIKEE